MADNLLTTELAIMSIIVKRSAGEKREAKSHKFRMTAIWTVLDAVVSLAVAAVTGMTDPNTLPFSLPHILPDYLSI